MLQKYFKVMTNSLEILFGASDLFSQVNDIERLIVNICSSANFAHSKSFQTYTGWLI
jgi:hypothetical protein